MAERRMFAKTIIDSDPFLDMSVGAQALYFHLCMRADDEGFVNNPRKIQRMIGANEDDLKVLLAKRFLIAFESGVIVIKHWKIHNLIQKDRFKPTVYVKERAMLRTKENKAYTTEPIPAPALDTTCIQNGNKLETQVRLGKDRLVLHEDDDDEEDRTGGIYSLLSLDEELYTRACAGEPEPLQWAISHLKDMDDWDGVYKVVNLAVVAKFRAYMGRAPVPAELDVLARIAALRPTGWLIGEAIQRAAARGVKSVVPYVVEIIKWFDVAKIESIQDLIAYDKEYGK